MRRLKNVNSISIRVREKSNSCLACLKIDKNNIRLNSFKTDVQFLIVNEDFDHLVDNQTEFTRFHAIEFDGDVEILQ